MRYRLLFWIIAYVMPVITILGVSCNICTAQTTRQHQDAIYLAVQPTDYGVGMRGDYHFKNLGLYSSASYGNWGLYKENDVKHHVKFSTGLLIHLMDSSLYNCDFTCGINYHLLNSVRAPDSPVNPIIYKPWSLEAGVTSKFRNIAIAIATDILRWEPCIYIGLPISKVR